MSKAEKCSLKKGLFDIKAPLATFDTIDLGEDTSCIVALCKDTRKFAHHLVLSENRGTKESGSDDCDGFPKVSLISRKYEKLQSTTEYEKLDEESDKSESTPVFKKDGNDSKESSGSFSDSSSSEFENALEHRDFFPNDRSLTQDYVTGNLFGQQSSPIILRHSRLCENDTSLENTPVSSPLLTRSHLPELIKELDTVKSESKKKALEKRIQRLQVTTKGIDRPRSTTPINIVSLGEYKEISSPDVCKNQFENKEKLKIKLPDEHEYTSKHKSPRKARQANQDIFDFGEDHLFTHTKQALVLHQDGFSELSPRRILIPPTLSPSMSPISSPGRQCMILPESPIHKKNEPRILLSDTRSNESSDVWKSKRSEYKPKENWAHFDENTSLSKDNPKCSASQQNNFGDISQDMKECIGFKAEEYKNFDQSEDILIINVVESNDGQRHCDIKMDEHLQNNVLEVHKENHNLVGLSCEAMKDECASSVLEEPHTNTDTPCLFISSNTDLKEITDVEDCDKHFILDKINSKNSDISECHSTSNYAKSDLIFKENNTLAEGEQDFSNHVESKTPNAKETSIAVASENQEFPICLEKNH